jgi:hypothetical protein
MRFRERLFLTTIIFGIISVGALFSKETAISKIGREVLLLDDGTWSEFNRELLALEPFGFVNEIWPLLIFSFGPTQVLS